MSNNFPKDYSELTLEYLNKALYQKIHNEIISFKEGEKIEPGFTGKIVRIIPKYKENKENLPKSFIIKFQTDNIGIKTFMTKIKAYEKEIKIYEILNKINKLNTPKIFHAEIDSEKSNYIIIMEDLNSKGLFNINKNEPLNIDILKLIVEYFAELHSNFFGKERQKNIEWLYDYNFANYMKDFTINNFDKKKQFFIFNNKKILNENLIKIIKNIKILDLFEKIEPSCDKNKSRTTLLHGDTQIGNLLINKKKDKIAMIDWQYINIGLGLKDIFLFMGITFDEKSIKENDINELKYLYYNYLEKKGINYDKKLFEEDWKNLCLISLCNIISASAEENIGDDEEKKKKYGEYLSISEKRFITFLQKQNL